MVDTEHIFFVQIAAEHCTVKTAVCITYPKCMTIIPNSDHTIGMK